LVYPYYPLQARTTIASLSIQRRDDDVTSSIEFARSVRQHSAQSGLRSFAVVLCNAVRICQVRRKAVAFSRLRRHAYQQGIEVRGRMIGRSVLNHERPRWATALSAWCLCTGCIPHATTLRACLLQAAVRSATHSASSSTKSRYEAELRAVQLQHDAQRLELESRLAGMEKEVELARAQVLTLHGLWGAGCHVCYQPASHG
jgi:hypothetical protein